MRDYLKASDLSDEASQTMEGDTMIDMTIESMRVVILLGDLRQLSPTVLSEGANEGADFLTRSLLSRIIEAGHPQQTLSNNYRNHPEILKLFNKAVYNGALVARDNTAIPEKELIEHGISC